MKTKYKCENCGAALLPPIETSRWDEAKFWQEKEKELEEARK